MWRSSFRASPGPSNTRRTTSTRGLRCRWSAAALRLHHEKPFDLIHAHFIYPDGVVASRIGRELGIPVMTSEHSFWTPWLEDRPRVGRQVRAALPDVDLVAPVSGFEEVRLADYAGERIKRIVLPEPLDDETFTPTEVRAIPTSCCSSGLSAASSASTCSCGPWPRCESKGPMIRLRILSAKALSYAADRREIDALIEELA